MLGGCGSLLTDLRAAGSWTCAQPRAPRRSCSPVPTSFSSFIFIFLIFIFPVSALTASLQFLCLPGTQPRPRWSACSVNICLMNGWLMFIYSVYMKWMVWLLLLFGEGSRPHLNLIICGPRAPWWATSSFLPGTRLFHICHMTCFTFATSRAD